MTQWMPAPRAPQSALAPYIQALRGHLLLVLIIVGTIVAASVAWLTVRTPEYRASAEVLVTPMPAETVALAGIPLLQDLRDPTRTIQTAAELLDTGAAAERAAAALGPEWTPGRVSAALTVQPKGQTNILQLSAIAASPEDAADIANAYANAALAVRRAQLRVGAERAIPRVRRRLQALPAGAPGAGELQATLNRLEALRDGDPTLSLAQAATPSSTPLGASPSLVVILALLAGSVLGIATALAIDRISPARITGEDELVDVFPLPILARLPVLPRQRRGNLSLEVQPEAREALRTVKVQLELGREGTRTVMLTSPSPGDGKTTTALGLATTIAESGARVILIDTDVRRMPIRAGLAAEQGEAAPRALTRRWSAAAGPAEKTPLRPLLRRVAGQPNLHLLDAMDVAFDSTDPYARARFNDLVQAATREADWVILDTPPIGVIGDALTLVHLVDDVLVVTKMRSTRRLHVEVARDLLNRAGVVPTGYLVIGERTVGAYPYPVASSSR